MNVALHLDGFGICTEICCGVQMVLLYPVDYTIQPVAGNVGSVFAKRKGLNPLIEDILSLESPVRPIDLYAKFVYMLILGLQRAILSYRVGHGLDIAKLETTAELMLMANLFLIHLLSHAAKSVAFAKFKFSCEVLFLILFAGIFTHNPSGTPV